MRFKPTPREYLLSKINTAIQATIDLKEALEDIHLKLHSREYSTKAAKQEVVAVTRPFKYLLSKFEY